MKTRYRVFSSLYKIRYKWRLFYRTRICIILVLCIAMKNIELDYTEKLFRQWIHRMAFCAFMLCWGGSTFCKKSTFCVLNDPEFPIEIQNTSLLQSLWLFQCDKSPSTPWAFSFVFHDVVVAVVVRRVEVGWEGGSADGGERHGRNPRLKLMCWHHFVLLHRFLFPFSSRFAIRMKMGAEDLFCLCLSFLVVSCLVLSSLVLFCLVLTCLTSCCVLSCCLNLIPSLNLCLNLNSNLTRNLYLNLNLNVHLLLNLNLNPCQRYWKHNWTHNPYASSSQR
jgi:hypothetical protein